MLAKTGTLVDRSLNECKKSRFCAFNPAKSIEENGVSKNEIVHEVSFFFLWSNLFFSPAWAEKYPFSIIKECVDDSMTAGLFIEMLHDFSDY